MNPEQSKALPELEKIYASCFDNAREDVDVQHERGLMAIYNAGKASAVAVKVEACAREICSREDWASVTRDGVEEIILRHLTDESDEVRRLREALEIAREYVEDALFECECTWRPDETKSTRCDLDREYLQMIDAAIQNKSEESTTKERV